MSAAEKLAPSSVRLRSTRRPKPVTTEPITETDIIAGLEAQNRKLSESIEALKQAHEADLNSVRQEAEQWWAEIDRLKAENAAATKAPGGTRPCGDLPSGDRTDDLSPLLGVLETRKTKRFDAWDPLGVVLYAVSAEDHPESVLEDIIREVHATLSVLKLSLQADEADDVAVDALLWSLLRRTDAAAHLARSLRVAAWRASR